MGFPSSASANHSSVVSQGMQIFLVIGRYVAGAVAVMITESRQTVTSRRSNVSISHVVATLKACKSLNCDNDEIT